MTWTNCIRKILSTKLYLILIKIKEKEANDVLYLQSLPNLARVVASVTRLRIYWTLGNFLKALATINLPKSPTFLGNFCKGVKIYHFYNEIIFGQLL